MALVDITPAQLMKMIDCCEDMQARIPANGMPELDVRFSEMIVEMQKAYDDATGPPAEEIKGPVV